MAALSPDRGGAFAEAHVVRRELVGGRRWDVHFQSGETLALPEGEGEAQAALAKFARMDQTASLLGRGFLRFDMRVPGKIYARTSAEPGKVAAPIVPPAAATAARRHRAARRDLTGGMTWPSLAAI